MTQIPPNTPVIVGAGQFTERLDSPDYAALSPVDITAAAARIALMDAGMIEHAARIDWVMTTRTFEDSAPVLAFPFGRSNNFPRSVSKRLGLNPPRAVWACSGGDSPQKLVAEACEAILAGDAQGVLIAGGEALSTAKQLVKLGATADWSEQIEGDVDDRGAGIDYVSPDELANGLITPPLFHGLIENARRGEAGASRSEWLAQMAKLFAPLSAVAEANPLAATNDRAYNAQELATPGEGNRLIADPYTQRLIARDQVNQSAALVVVSSALADELGIPAAQRVYLHGHAAATEPPVTRRADIGHAPSAGLALNAALAAADKTLAEIALFDFYSCFPVAVSNAIEAIGLSATDPRGLTITGGLPYFGGPGNSYSLNALAEMMVRLRQSQGSYGLLAANGGFLSKYAVGIYSTEPKQPAFADSDALTAQVMSVKAPEIAASPTGGGRIETYTIDFDRSGQARGAVVVGRLDGTDQRFIARNYPDDASTLAMLVSEEPLGKTVVVAAGEHGNNFVLA